jgi:hypothetical protein
MSINKKRKIQEENIGFRSEWTELLHLSKTLWNKQNVSFDKNLRLKKLKKNFYPKSSLDIMVL